MPELARHQGTIMAARGTLRLVRAQGEALARYAGRALWPAARASVGRDPAFDPETRSWFAGQLEHIRSYLEYGAGASTLLASDRSEEHTSELQSLMRISYDVFCLQKNTHHKPLTKT